MARNERPSDSAFGDLLTDTADGDLASVIDKLHRDLAAVYARWPPTGLVERVLSGETAAGMSVQRERPWWSRRVLSLLHGRAARGPTMAAVAVLAAVTLMAGVGYAMHQLSISLAAKPDIVLSAEGRPQYIAPAPASAVYFPSFVPPGMAERFAGEIYTRAAFRPETGQWGMRVYCSGGLSQALINSDQIGMCGLDTVFEGGPSSSQLQRIRLRPGASDHASLHIDRHPGPFQPVRIRLDASDSPAFVAPLLRSVTPTNSASPTVVWVAMHALPPGGRSMAIAEWRVGTAPYHLSGTRTTIRGIPATLVAAGDHLSVMLTRGQTDILIRTNVSRQELFHTVASLAPIDVSQPPA